MRMTRASSHRTKRANWSLSTIRAVSRRIDNRQRRRQRQSPHRPPASPTIVSAGARARRRTTRPMRIQLLPSKTWSRVRWRKVRSCPVLDGLKPTYLQFIVDEYRLVGRIDCWSIKWCSRYQADFKHISKNLRHFNIARKGTISRHTVDQ